METERQLLDDVRSGDRQAMRCLYERYAGYAMAVALRYVPDRDDARDVLQDSFIKIFTSVDRFDYRGEGSLKNWVSRIVTNEAINHLKRQSRTLFIENRAELPDQSDTSEQSDAPDLRGVPPDVLTEMIGRLPTGYRLVLNLFVFEQLSHKEIAQRLGIKADTSASQFLRAKKRLAQMIKEYLNRQRT